MDAFLLLAVAAQQDGVGASLTADRFWATSAAVVALIGVVVGCRALARSANRSGSSGQSTGAIVALVAGLIAVLIGGLLLATADAGPGSGNGIIGAIVAAMLGLAAIGTGGLALARARRVN
jgi:hypothetical protein